MVRKTARLFLLLIALFGIAGSAAATEITISSTTISNWQNQTAAPRLRIYLSKPVVTSDNRALQSGSPQSGVVYQSITCSVASGTLTIPTVTIHSLSDAPVGSDAFYSAFFYTSSGQLITEYRGFSRFSVPAAPTTTTWAAIAIYNAAPIAARPPTTYTREQISVLLSSAGNSIATFLLKTPDLTLSNAFAFSTLGTGILKNQTGTGNLSIAVAGTDYQSPLVAGIDYLAPNGNGSGLTNLNASNLASGTLPDVRFPVTLPAVSGANLTNLNASNLASGTLPDARFPATLPAVSGANLTNLNATNLASGMVPDLRLSANVSLLGSSISLTSEVTGTLPIANGGTGSATQNFVDLTNIQSIGGAKTLTAKLTTLATGKSIEALENPLSSSMLSTSNENDYLAIGFQRGTSGVAAATGTPFINIQIHQRPNASVGQTLINYGFFASRHGSGASPSANGGAEAVYNLVGVIESDGTATTLSGMHDIAGVVGLAISRAGSTARSYGAHYDARLESTSGAAIGAESVVRNSAGTAPTIQSGTEAGRTVGFNIVGRATGSGSKNTVGLLFQTGNGATSAFKTGIYFEANTVDTGGYAIDFNALGVIPAMRLANASPIVGRNAAGSGDVVLFSINGSDQLSFASTGNASVFGGTVTTPTLFGGSSAASTLTLKGTSNGSPANAYVLINTVSSGVYPGTVGIGAPSSSFLAVAGQTDILHLQAKDGDIGLMVLDTYANGGNVTSGIAFRSAGGSAASPSATAANASLASFGGRQHTGSAFSSSNQAAIQFRAAEAASPSALGTYITLETTPAGSTGRAERWRVEHGGWFVGKELTANPTTTELAAGDQAALYVKGDKFVIAYNQGGTVKYIAFTLDGSTTTFTNSSSAP